VEEPTFAAGASYFGVADLEALTRETHKFESHYLDGLIGPYPEAAAIYRRRSPINAPVRMCRPVIIFQGLEDEVVPPAQAIAMTDALKAAGVPHAYLAFVGELHGFTDVETIRRALEAELSFYARIFVFDLADKLTPVPIMHEDRLCAPRPLRQRGLRVKSVPIVARPEHAESAE
jgi:dipeptidyl aminopeptidase/acylaminoacyl peptidase